jgi:hypothetical protein
MAVENISSPRLHPFHIWAILPEKGPYHKCLIISVLHLTIIVNYLFLKILYNVIDDSVQSLGEMETS